MLMDTFYNMTTSHMCLNIFTFSHMLYLFLPRRRAVYKIHVPFYPHYLSHEPNKCDWFHFFILFFRHDVVPIVMGAPKEDYLRAAPHNSFIHVDDFASPRALAAYLHLLDQSDYLYNEYFRWKGTGTFINTYFWCRVCAMMHDESREEKVYGDLERWWRGDGVCVGRSSWKRHAPLPYISDYYSKK